MRYKLPLRRTYSKVFDADYHPAFDFPLEMMYPTAVQMSPEDKDKLVDIINDTAEGKYPNKLIYNDNDATIYDGDKEFLIIRGWGYLTGTGGLNLPQDKAIIGQIEFANYIISKLNT